MLSPVSKETKRDIQNQVETERDQIKDLMDATGGRRSKGQFLADKMALAVGSWTFVISQTVFIAIWILLNITLTVYQLCIKSWDPYPFILLNFVLSFQAAYTGPILLISANRASERERKLARKDFEYGLRVEQQLELVMTKLGHIEYLLSQSDKE